MTIAVEWMDDSHTILVFRFSQTWQWEQMFTATDAGRRLLNSVSHSVSVLADFTNARWLPSLNLGVMNRLATQPRIYNHPNTTYIYVAGTQRQLYTMGNLLRKLFPRIHERYRFARTLQEALLLIAHERSA